MLEVALLLVAIFLYHKYEDYKLNNYDISKVSSQKMCIDCDKSTRKRIRNTIRGKYDKGDLD